MRILIVEDDPQLGAGILAGLKQSGFQADWVTDGAAGLAALRAELFAAVVLDLGLPRLPGLDLLQKLRADGNAVPVLILTARDTAADTIAGLDCGADDYMVKPFDLGELAARLRALARRAGGSATPEIVVDALRIDPASRGVTWKNLPVDLAPREFDLLLELARQAGRVLTRSQLETSLYSWGEEVGSNAIEVHVHHLRRKLDPALIRTVRGVGYVMPRTTS